MATLKLFVSSAPAAFAFELPGKPEAQPRPGGSCRRYNPKKQLMLRARDKISALAGPLSTHAGGDDNPLFPRPGHLAVELVFHMPRPRKHMSSTGQLLEKIRDRFHFAFPRPKVDVDNLAKFILDAMTGPVYWDDSQIVELVILKMNDNEGSCEGRTEVKVTEIANMEQLTLFRNGH